jgi:predicted secreted protein
LDGSRGSAHEDTSVKPPVLTLAANGSTFAIVVRQPLAIELHERPTTGYRWHLDVDPGIVILSSDYTQHEGSVVGRGGMRRFVVAAGAVGDFTIRAKLWRPWLGETSVIDRFTIALHAR